MIDVGRGNGVVTQRTRITRFMGVDGELTSLRVETVQTSPTPHPQEPAFVLSQIEILLVVTPRILLMDNKTVARRIKAIKTIVGRYPHDAVMVDQDPAHNVAAQTGRVVWLV